VVWCGTAAVDVLALAYVAHAVGADHVAGETGATTLLAGAARRTDAPSLWPHGRAHEHMGVEGKRTIGTALDLLWAITNGEGLPWKRGQTPSRLHTGCASAYGGFARRGRVFRSGVDVTRRQQVPLAPVRPVGLPSNGLESRATRGVPAFASAVCRIRCSRSVDASSARRHSPRNSIGAPDTPEEGCALAVCVTVGVIALALSTSTTATEGRMHKG